MERPTPWKKPSRSQIGRFWLDVLRTSPESDTHLGRRVTPGIGKAEAPDDRQLSNIRAELHAIADRCVDAWPDVRRRQSDMVRGAARGSGLGVVSGSGDPTYGAAMAPGADPTADLAKWLRLFSEFVVRAYELDDKRGGIMATALETKKPDRPSAYEACGECGRPVLRGKRLDGALYHNGGDEDACWWKAYNARHGRRPAESERGDGAA